MLTLEHYRSVLGNSEVWRALPQYFPAWPSSAHPTTMLLGAIVAYISTRTRWAGRQVIDVLAWLPWMMPGMVLAVDSSGDLPFCLAGDLDLRDHLGVVDRLCRAGNADRGAGDVGGGYRRLSFDLEECSRVHGATWWQTLWRIMIALAWPSFASDGC